MTKYAYIKDISDGSVIPPEYIVSSYKDKKIKVLSGIIISQTDYNTKRMAKLGFTEMLAPPVEDDKK